MTTKSSSQNNKMGFVGCLEKPPNTPSTLRTPKKNVLYATLDESFKSPNQNDNDHRIALNDVSVCQGQTDSFTANKFQTPEGPNRVVLKQSSWGHIDLFLDSLNKEDDCETNGSNMNPIARKAIRLDSKKTSSKKKANEHPEEQTTAEKGKEMECSAETLCRRHQSPVRRLVRTLSLTSTRSIMSSPRRRTQLRSQLSLSKLDDETKKRECSQKEVRAAGSFRLCATETGAVDTSTPEAALCQMSLSPQRKRHVKRQQSDSRLVSISPVKTRSLDRQMVKSIVLASNLKGKEAEQRYLDLKTTSKEGKTWDEIITEFDSISNE